MRHHLQRHLAVIIDRARDVVPGAVISGATVGAVSWLLTALIHHL
ncbi:hypothetical protein [Actinomadura fibrosa]|uniref:Uncharacterized protein n=1 Tax=Actinomadura fibrosa TaxID=111802 RepID=A0ABW2XWT1_9ACTN|nr:hypothetical protein [Actinomadura fibrosa]